MNEEPQSIHALTHEVVTLLRAQHFEHARNLLELIFASGEAPPFLIMAYGIVLSELGDQERAARVAELLQTVDDPLFEESGLRESARLWLPGGALSKAKREALQNDAEKWLPRVSKMSTSQKSR